MKVRHLAALRSICETLGKDWDTSAHCICGKLCIDPIHYKTKEITKKTKFKQYLGLSIKVGQAI